MNHRLIFGLFLVFSGCVAVITPQVHAKDKYWIKVSPTVTGPFTVDVDFQTNIPGSITLYLSLGLNGLKPQDTFIGLDKSIDVPITNGRGKGTIDASNPNNVFPHGFPLRGGRYDVEVSFSPFWAVNVEQASKLGIKDPIRGKASVQLVGSGASQSKKDKPSPQLLAFKELYLELLSFKDNPEFHNLGLSWGPAQKWEKKREELSRSTINNTTFKNEQIKLDIYVEDLITISGDYMNGEKTELTYIATQKMNKAFGLKSTNKKNNSTASKYAYGFDVKLFCGKVSEVAGGSYQIEETCRGQENDAINKINSMSIPKRIADYCRKVGQAAGGSYVIMHTCITQEINAKGRL
jgi:hypothetical protein